MIYLAGAPGGGSMGNVQEKENYPPFLKKDYGVTSILQIKSQ